MTQETKVIHQVLAGDIESFRLIVERYERPIVRMIKNITNNREFCEDIAQDVFFTALLRERTAEQSIINNSLFVG